MKIKEFFKDRPIKFFIDIIINFLSTFIVILILEKIISWTTTAGWMGIFIDGIICFIIFGIVSKLSFLQVLVSILLIYFIL